MKLFVPSFKQTFRPDEVDIFYRTVDSFPGRVSNEVVSELNQLMLHESGKEAGSTVNCGYRFTRRGFEEVLNRLCTGGCTFLFNLAGITRKSEIPAGMYSVEDAVATYNRVLIRRFSLFFKSKTEYRLIDNRIENFASCVSQMRHQSEVLRQIEAIVEPLVFDGATLDGSHMYYYGRFKDKGFTFNGDEYRMGWYIHTDIFSQFAYGYPIFTRLKDGARIATQHGRLNGKRKKNSAETRRATLELKLKQLLSTKIDPAIFLSRLEQSKSQTIPNWDGAIPKIKNCIRLTQFNLGKKYTDDLLSMAGAFSAERKSVYDLVEAILTYGLNYAGATRAGLERVAFRTLFDLSI